MAATFAEQTVIDEVSLEAERELYELGQVSAKTRLKNMIKTILGDRPDAYDPIFWPAGLLLLGLVEAGHADRAGQYLDQWIKSGMKVMHTDDALAGYVILRLYETTGKAEYKAAADAIYRFLTDARQDDAGSIVYNSERSNSYIYADGTGQAALFLARYGQVFQNEEAMKQARAQIQNFLEHGFDNNSGLMYHGYDVASGVKMGIIGWGRAAGWFLMGMTEVAKYCDPKADARLLAAYRQLVHNVMRYQRKDRLFSWQLEAVEGPADTSATGMIWWSVMNGLRAGLTHHDVIGAAADSASALAHQIEGGKVYGSSAECIDFAEYRQRYGNNAWGQGAALAFLAQEIIKE